MAYMCILFTLFSQQYSTIVDYRTMLCKVDVNNYLCSGETISTHFFFVSNVQSVVGVNSNIE